MDSSIKISITVGRYGSLTGSKATVQATANETTLGSVDGTSSTPAAATITYSSTMPAGSYPIVFKCTNASSTSNGARITEITITGTVASSDPSINASDVTINSDATSGEISYELKNAVSGAKLYASSSESWLTVSPDEITASPLSFTTSINEGSENRTATVTFTYKSSDGTTTLATKDVTVTQNKPITYTNYDKVSASTMVIGGTYVWYASNSYTKAIATSLGSNTFFGAATLASDSKVTDTQLQLTTETPQQFIFSQKTATDWTIADAGTPTNYLYVSGDKKIAWGTTANVWTLSGTDAPAFTCSTYSSTAYTLFGNLSSTRFCAYKAIGSMQNAILYHLNDEATSKLSLNDGTTTTDYTVKQGFAWVPIAPDKDGAEFQGWATTEGGEVAYALEAAYTMGTSDATLYAVWKAQTTAPTITTNIESAYTVIKGNTLSLTIAADGADSYQWYSNTTNSTEGATVIDGATSESYTYTGTTKDNVTYIFCAVTNNIGTTNSTIAAVTTVGSSTKQLVKVEFSNNFDAFITEPKTGQNGKIQVYYMKGETAPTMTENTITVLSDAEEGSQYLADENTIVVYAEDGTDATYDVTKTEVEPITSNTTDGTFDGNETWVKNGYGFVSGKGVAFSKTDYDWSREAVGKTRIYFFVGPAKNVTLTNTLITSDRNIKVYVNGTEQTNITKIGKSTATDGSNTITITTSETLNNMIAIVSNQTGGDGGFSKYTINVPTEVTINLNKTYTTFCAALDLDFTNNTNVAAYKAKYDNTNGDVVALTQVTEVPAGTGVILKKLISDATSATVNVIASADAVSDNELVGATTATTLAYSVTSGGNTIYNYVLKDGAFHPVENNTTLAAGKAYLPCTLNPENISNAKALNFVFADDDATAIKSVNNTTINNAAYNLCGQRVNANAKGIVIINGKKYFNK